ncbi:leucine-rich repeat domain-containing protein [Flavobacterium branchiophilum]|uniref:Cell surface protein n=1 Tax=Flavobacterium branchiophilum TaxID=55197 RepID=A0A2H3KFN0_9FLAO|nr:leucine-rich repeat domain-containing protein [Flavobacterium branchiophilum]PDS22106.1 cell surface protein [Flavobacterium branchiophilum]
MKNLYIIFLTTIISHFISFGQNFMVDGIKYRVTSSTENTVEVDINTSNSTSITGSVNIPTSVSNGSITYSVTGLGLQAFGGCTGLTSIIIPNSVTYINSFAFGGCTGLTSIIIPNSVTSMGGSTFLNCTGLISVIISNSVTSIGTKIFQNCTSLTTVNIPNSVTNIFSEAFANCTGLTSVTIPNSVTSIGIFAFQNCTGLSSVTVNWTTPLSVNASIFASLNLPTITLNVPTGTTALYDATPVWTNFNIATLDINEFKYNKLIFYPNPTSNLIKIQNKTNTIENFEYRIVDLTGRIVKSGNSKFNEDINIESLTIGNYIFQIETENGEKFTEKLIKN